MSTFFALVKRISTFQNMHMLTCAELAPGIHQGKKQVLTELRQLQKLRKYDKNLEDVEQEIHERHQQLQLLDDAVQSLSKQTMDQSMKVSMLTKHDVTFASLVRVLPLLRYSKPPQQQQEQKQVVEEKGEEENEDADVDADDDEDEEAILKQVATTTTKTNNNISHSPHLHVVSKEQMQQYVTHFVDFALSWAQPIPAAVVAKTLWSCNSNSSTSSPGRNQYQHHRRLINLDQLLRLIRHSCERSVVLPTSVRRELISELFLGTIIDSNNFYTQRTMIMQQGKYNHYNHYKQQQRTLISNYTKLDFYPFASIQNELGQVAKLSMLSSSPTHYRVSNSNSNNSDSSDTPWFVRPPRDYVLSLLLFLQDSNSMEEVLKNIKRQLESRGFQLTEIDNSNNSNIKKNDHSNASSTADASTNASSSSDGVNSNVSATAESVISTTPRLPELFKRIAIILTIRLCHLSFTASSSHRYNSSSLQQQQQQQQQSLLSRSPEDLEEQQQHQQQETQTSDDFFFSSSKFQNSSRSQSNTNNNLLSSKPILLQMLALWADLFCFMSDYEQSVFLSEVGTRSLDMILHLVREEIPPSFFVAGISPVTRRVEEVLRQCVRVHTRVVSNPKYHHPSSSQSTNIESENSSSTKNENVIEENNSNSTTANNSSEVIITHPEIFSTYCKHWASGSRSVLVMKQMQSQYNYYRYSKRSEDEKNRKENEKQEQEQEQEATTSSKFREEVCNLQDDCSFIIESLNIMFSNQQQQFSSSSSSSNSDPSTTTTTTNSTRMTFPNSLRRIHMLAYLSKVQTLGWLFSSSKSSNPSSSSASSSLATPTRRHQQHQKMIAVNNILEAIASNLTISSEHELERWCQSFISLKIENLKFAEALSNAIVEHGSGGGSSSSSSSLHNNAGLYLRVLAMLASRNIAKGRAIYQLVLRRVETSLPNLSLVQFGQKHQQLQQQHLSFFCILQMFFAAQQCGAFVLSQDMIRNQIAPVVFLLQKERRTCLPDSMKLSELHSFSCLIIPVITAGFVKSVPARKASRVRKFSSSSSSSSSTNNNNSNNDTKNLKFEQQQQQKENDKEEESGGEKGKEEQKSAVVSSSTKRNSRIRRDGGVVEHLFHSLCEILVHLFTRLPNCTAESSLLVPVKKIGVVAVPTPAAQHASIRAACRILRDVATRMIFKEKHLRISRFRIESAISSYIQHSASRHMSHLMLLRKLVTTAFEISTDIYLLQRRRQKLLERKMGFGIRRENANSNNNTTTSSSSLNENEEEKSSENSERKKLSSSSSSFSEKSTTPGNIIGAERYDDVDSVKEAKQHHDYRMLKHLYMNISGNSMRCVCQNLVFMLNIIIKQQQEQQQHHDQQQEHQSSSSTSRFAGIPTQLQVRALLMIVKYWTYLDFLPSSSKKRQQEQQEAKEEEKEKENTTENTEKEKKEKSLREQYPWLHKAAEVAIILIENNPNLIMNHPPSTTMKTDTNANNLNQTTTNSNSNNYYYISVGTEIVQEFWNEYENGSLQEKLEEKLLKRLKKNFSDSILLKEEEAASGDDEVEK